MFDDGQFKDYPQGYMSQGLGGELWRTNQGCAYLHCFQRHRSYAV